ncbi:MAG: hypothetical protein AB8G96_04015 [Phycisphaerales bacterium]
MHVPWMGWLLLGLGVVTVMSGAFAFATRARGSRFMCPGPRPTGWRRLDIREWYRRIRCGYDCSGLRATPIGTRTPRWFIGPPPPAPGVRCPECGSVTLSRDLLAAGPRIGRFRIVATLAALTMLTTGGAIAYVGTHGHLTSLIPDRPLAMMARTGRAGYGSPLRDEIHRRASTGGFGDAPARSVAAAVVADLRDDDIPWNSYPAQRLLDDLWPASRTALEYELEIGDLQSRILAARVLRHHVKTPSDALLRACVQDLRNDRGLVTGQATDLNMRYAAWYLMEWANEAEPHLVAALGSDDMQQRLIAAGIAGFANFGHCNDAVAEVLIDHLQDNDIREDARLAIPALHSMGESILPMLRRHVDHGDDQSRAILLALIERIEHPDRRTRDCVHAFPPVTTRAPGVPHTLSFGSAMPQFMD